MRGAGLTAAVEPGPRITSNVGKRERDSLPDPGEATREQGMARDKGHRLATFGLALTLCCGVKLLLLSGGLGVLAGLATDHGWPLIAAGGFLLLAAGWWWFRRRTSARCKPPVNETKEKQTACPD